MDNVVEPTITFPMKQYLDDEFRRLNIKISAIQEDLESKYMTKEQVEARLAPFKWLSSAAGAISLLAVSGIMDKIMEQLF